jgi:hypothetical protein
MQRGDGRQRGLGECDGMLDAWEWAWKGARQSCRSRRARAGFDRTPIRTVVLTGERRRAERKRGKWPRRRRGIENWRSIRTRANALSGERRWQPVVNPCGTWRKERGPRGYTLSGASVNWGATSSVAKNFHSAGRTRTYNQPVNSRLLYH